MEIASYLHNVRKHNPLVHNMTNQVVANHVANGLLALGASPIMAYAPEEVADIAKMATALVLNIGTITKETANSMILAAQAANEQNIPVVLDPVGVGASKFRSEIVAQFLKKVHVDLIRGNSGEITTLASISWLSKGVDAGEGRASLKEIAEIVAQKNNCVVAISGAQDWISDGRRTLKVCNGHEVMTKVTGMGCLLSSVCGAFIGANELIFESTVAAHYLYGVVGERAYEKSVGPGSFCVNFIDELSLIHEQENVVANGNEWIRRWNQ